MSLYGRLVSINESNTGKTYDKVKWHIDNGEDFDKVIRKFKSIFSFLDREKLLNKEGKEEYNDLSEDSILNSSMVTSIGKQFLDKYYDSKILPAEKTSSILTSCWNDFQKKNEKINQKDLEIIFNKFYKLFINELNTYKNKIEKYDIEKRDLQFAIIPTDRYEGNLSKYANIFLKIFKNTIKKVENDSNFENIRIQDDWIYNDTAYCISFYKK